MHHREKGFTLVELLMAMGVIGVLAAIAIWNYMGALQRAKQKRTMADMRTIAVAWEARAGDTRSYTAAGASFTFPAVAISYPAVNAVISPTYLKSIPQFDGWGRPFSFATDVAPGGNPSTEYGIRSPGRDGQYDGMHYMSGPTSNYDCDIVYSAGSFITFPEGVQGKD